MKEIKIDLGAGKACPEGYIGVDKVALPGVAIVHDCEQGLPFEDNYADEIRSFDFIEHIHQDRVIHIMNEIWRVLKPGGKFVFKIPDAERGQGADQDPTHVSRWVKNSFKYYENRYYHDIYGIKAKFKIGSLESVRYEIEYWGENWALVGYLIAIKDSGGEINIPKIETEEAKIEFREEISMSSLNSRVFTTDDLSISNLKYFEYWKRVKQKYPELKLIAFTVARMNDKDEEDISLSQDFRKFYELNKDWVTIQPHGLTHQRPQLGWLPYDEQKRRIEESIRILKPYLPKEIIYRFPGFRTMSYSEKILKECGVSAVAHQNFIKYFDGRIVSGIVNTHCTNSFENPIVEIWNKITL